KNMIETKAPDHIGYDRCAITLDDTDHIARETGSQQIGNDSRSSRRQFGWLENDGIACRDSRRQRQKGQLEREIPGRDDEDHAERVLVDPGRCRPVDGIGAYPARSHPAAEPFQQESDLCQHQTRFRGIGFFAALFQIGIQCLADGVFAIDDRLSESLQLLPPPGVPACDAGVEIPAKRCDVGGVDHDRSFKDSSEFTIYFYRKLLPYVYY